MHAIASRHYAFEGRCYVLCAGSYLTLDDLPADFEPREALEAGGELGQADGVILPGGSGIIGPDGAWLAGPVLNEPAIVAADLDLDRIAGEQLALDTAGHYHRPDVFDVRVDTRPRVPATFLGPGSPDRP